VTSVKNQAMSLRIEDFGSKYMLRPLLALFAA